MLRHAQSMLPIDAGQIDCRDEEIEQFQPRTIDVAPLVKWILINGWPDVVRINWWHWGNHSRQNFNVEDPPGAERCRNEFSKIGCDAKQLCTALCVVHGQAQDERRCGGECPTHEMSQRASPNIAA